MQVAISHPTNRPNFTEVTVGDVTLWFSYETVVGFRDWRTGRGLRVTQNYWGPTTGKHLNWIDNGDKASRLDADDFKLELIQSLRSLGVTV